MRRRDAALTPPARGDQLLETGGQLAEGDGLRKDPVLSVEGAGNACVVKLGGELDLYNAPQVRETLLRVCADSPERVVVDLSEVEFIDSTALGVLIEARRELTNHRAFLLAGPPLETRRALEISGLDKHFTVHDSVSEALVAKV
jgi:anti-sigma B factor antagonist